LIVFQASRVFSADSDYIDDMSSADTS